MDVLRYRFTQRHSQFVLEPTQSLEVGRPATSKHHTAEEMAIKASRLDRYRELAEQEKPLELRAG